eukprot:s8037_g1.t1
MDLCELGTSVGVCDAVGAALKNWTVSKLATLSDLSSEELQSILERRAGRAVSEEEISSFSALVAAADVWASSSRISHTGLQSLEWTGAAERPPCADWVLGAFGETDHFVAYLEARAAEPCGRSVPGSCFKTLLFMESAGELLASAKISAHPAVRNCLEELSVELADNNLRGKKQACQLLVSQVCAMERVVLLDAAPQ